MPQPSGEGDCQGVRDIVKIRARLNVQTVPMEHPCLRCGACCACFRVAFHWLEADNFAGGVTPPELTERLDAHRLVMRGTRSCPTRCVALVGTIGEAASCGIYAQRPSPCRELLPAWENGEASAQCDRARAAHGLPPLTPADWPAPSRAA